MSGLHISLLTLRALISTTLFMYVWACVYVQAACVLYEKVNKCALVFISLLLGVCHVHLCNHELLSVFTQVQSRFVHSVNPTSLTPGQRELTWCGRKGREEEKVRKRWRTTLNSGSRSANVKTHTRTCEHMIPQATRRTLQMSSFILFWGFPNIHKNTF